MVADALNIEEPDFMFGQNRFRSVVPAEGPFAGLRELTAVGGVFTEVREAPLFVRRNVTDRLLVQTDFCRRFENRHAFVHAVDRLV